MAEIPPHGDTQQDIVAFKYPLPHLMRSLKEQAKPRIVALGSSSTAGEGNIVPFPARLEMLLREGFKDRMVDVLNRGIGGQEATSEQLRIKPDVIDEGPALVIWQVGTNAVFRDQEFDFESVVKAIETGLAQLANTPMDVVLMDLQYTTAVVKPGKKELADKMVARIAAAAETAGVNVFRRYALMQRWQDLIPMRELIDPADRDELHMSDWATRCVTQALFEAITRAPGAAS